MEFKGTIWEIETDHKSNGIIDTGMAHSIVEYTNHRYSVAAVWRDAPNAKDNAQLIAAAPELLEALQNIIRQIERENVSGLMNDPKYFGQIAINKALGL